MSRKRSSDYFSELIAEFSIEESSRSLIFVTHMLPDRPEVVAALESIFRSVTVIAIPYSISISALQRCSAPVLTPTMSELDSPEWVRALFNATATSPTVVLEIGGYFADLARSPGDSPLLVGCVEDTEAGHRRYSAIQPGVPVISVAHSPLKAAEDILVGASLVHSIESVIRSQASVLAGMVFAVLGFGKIGESVALHLRARGAAVLVVEPSASRALRATAHGFFVQELGAALTRVQAVVACTGRPSMKASDLASIMSDCLLFSGSSRQVEFEELLPLVSEVVGRLSRVRLGRYCAFIVDIGYPVNFADGAEIGPVLRAPQGELFVAAATVEEYPTGMHEVSGRVRERIATTWRRVFHDGFG